MTCYGSVELARNFRVVRKNLLTIAEEIPEAQYDFRPAPEARSVREMLGHILAISRGNYEGHAVRKMTTFAGMDYAVLSRERAEEARRIAALPKAQILDLLKADGAQWGAYLDQATEADLSVIVPFPPPAVPATKSRLEMLLSAKEHEMHHRGQLMVYERLLGIVPHLTRARQERQAGR